MRIGDKCKVTFSRSEFQFLGKVIFDGRLYFYAAYWDETMPRKSRDCLLFNFMSIRSCE